MSELTFATLFSGGGGADIGLIDAGLEHLWGVEYDKEISEAYWQNIGDCVLNDILQVDPEKLDRPDWLHASPVCKAFSAANANKGEQRWDIDCGRKVAEFIEVLRPQYFSLENVQAYQGAIAYQIIVNALNRLGYYCHSKVVNAADYGVPQSRKRLILIAYKGDFRWGFDPFRTGNKKHQGWYGAISDLLDDLPDSKLADWQIKVLPKEIKDCILMQSGNPNSNRKNKFKHSNEPSDTLTASVNTVRAVLVHPTDQRTMPVQADFNASFSLTASMNASRPKALLVESTGARSDRPLQTREPNEPSWTIRAMGQDNHWHRSNVLYNSRVVQLSTRCLARLQGFPDSYVLPDKKSLAGKIIGNAVCPPMMAAIAKEVLAA